MKRNFKNYIKQASRKVSLLDIFGSRPMASSPGYTIVSNTKSHTII